MMVTRSKAIKTTILTSFLIISLFYIFCDTESNQNMPVIPTVESAESLGGLYHDIVVDDSGNIHLIWEDRQRGLFYQKSSDVGETWSAPDILSHDSNSPRSISPRILSVGNTVLVFWSHNGLRRRVSIDSGMSWNEPEIVLSGYPSTHSRLISDKDELYLVYGTRDGLFFTKSEDLGTHWAKTIKIADRSRAVKEISTPSVIVYGESIHIIWSKVESYKLNSRRKNKGRIMYIRGSESGEKWEKARELDIFGEFDEPVYSAYINHPRICESGGTLLIAFERNGLKYLTSKDLGESWSGTTILTYLTVDGVSVCSKRSGGIYVFWIDRRHEKQDWWGYIPLHFIITWDANPSWHNRDLYFAFIQDEIVIKEGRLTPPISYFDRHNKSITCEPIGSGVAVFWSGKITSGKIDSESNVANQVYYEILDID